MLNYFFRKWLCSRLQSVSQVNTVLNAFEVWLSCNNYRDAVRFCFGPLIQLQLDDFVEFWNKHRIRKSRMSEQVAGVPNVLFDHPELKGIRLLIQSQ